MQVVPKLNAEKTAIELVFNLSDEFCLPQVILEPTRNGKKQFEPDIYKPC